MASTAAVRLGDAVRRLMDATVLTDCDDGVLTAAAADIDAVRDRLLAITRPTMPWPDEVAMRRGERLFSPVIGAANPLAPPVVVRVLEDRSVIAETTMRQIHEGPPGALHGGWVATLLDHVLGQANAAADVSGMTVELTVEYRRRTPLDVPLTIRARTDSVDGRRVSASGEIEAEGVVTAKARGSFLQPTEAHIEQLREKTGARLAVAD